MSWALAVPLAVGLSGPVIASGWPELLFLLAAAANVLALMSSAGLSREAPHLAEPHAGRADAAALAHDARLLTSSRWTMLSGYSLMFLVAPLLPEVFQQLGRPVAEATLWASCMGAVRVVTFAVLATFPGWHGRVWPLAAAALGLPVGFSLVVLGPSLPLVVFGEVLFGALAGLTYYAALYHAMVAKNAAVDAGGGHESLIGLGLALGPGVGLLGDLLAREGNNPLLSISLAAAPLVLTCWYGALRALPRSRSERANVGLR